MSEFTDTYLIKDAKIKKLESELAQAKEELKQVIKIGVEGQREINRKAHVENAKLKEALKVLIDAVEFYGNEMSYSTDDYRGVSGEMIYRRILYGDTTERNDVYSYAGKKAREALKKCDEILEGK